MNQAEKILKGSGQREGLTIKEPTDKPSDAEFRFKRQEEAEKAQVLQYVEETIAVAGLPSEDPLFWMYAQQAPDKDVAGAPLDFDKQIEWALEKTNNYRASLLEDANKKKTDETNTRIMMNEKDKQIEQLTKRIADMDKERREREDRLTAICAKIDASFETLFGGTAHGGTLSKPINSQKEKVDESENLKNELKRFKNTGVVAGKLMTIKGGRHEPVIKKNDDHLTDEFRTFLQKERANQESGQA